MKSKTILHRDKELTNWWVSIVHDERFEAICTYARAEFCEGIPNQVQLQGAEDMLRTLSTLTDNEESGSPPLTPGLHHIIDRLPPKHKE